MTFRMAQLHFEPASSSLILKQLEWIVDIPVD